jgi:DNA-directed RNA polymerase subunit M/transcription elongation factor TFIIS
LARFRVLLALRPVRQKGDIIATIMQTFDPAGEFLRISEHYRQMSDGELLLLARQNSELTEVAQQALATEISHRRLKAEDEVTAEHMKPPAPSTAKPPAFVLREPSQAHDSYGCDSSDDDSSGERSSYDEDRKLVELCTVWSLRDALQVQRILDVAGIPFFMGPEKAPGVEKVTSNFGNGVSVQIMQIGLPWAGQAMRNYEPADDPATKQIEKVPELPVRCPKCHSTEVILEDLITEPTAAADNSSPKYKWTCDSCGYRWEDDGVVEE